MNKCSRVGCSNQASNFVLWRNPKIHDASRQKTWAACKEHADYFVEYLSVRGFFMAIEEIK